MTFQIFDFLISRFANYLFFKVIKIKSDPARTTRLEKWCPDQSELSILKVGMSRNGTSKLRIELWSASLLYIYIYIKIVHNFSRVPWISCIFQTRLRFYLFIKSPGSGYLEGISCGRTSTVSAPRRAYDK